MRLNSKHTIHELERYIQMYLKEGISYKELRESYGLLLSQSTFSQKALRYQTKNVTKITTALSVLFLLSNDVERFL